MTLACVNLELWYTYSETQDYETILDKTYELAIQSIDEQLPFDTFIGLLLCEGFLYKNNDSFYNLLEKVYKYAKSKGVRKFYIVAGIAEDYQHELDKRNLNYEIVFWDFSVNGMYQSYKDRLDTLPAWHYSSNKFLFLGGVPSRPNRIGLLSHMYDRGLLENAEWSFFPPTTDEDKTWCRDYLDHYEDEEYEEFLKYVTRSVDDRYSAAKDYARLTGKQWADTDIMQTEFLQDPNYIDPKIFTHTSLSIISEGYAYPPITDTSFLTEKTWRAIAHRHPFMLADSPDRYAYLKSKGIRTFEEYFFHSDYVYYGDRNKFEKIVENIIYFMDNKDRYIEQIQKDVEHNYNVFLDIVKQNDCILNSLNIDLEQRKTWFDQKSFVHLFRIPK